jgi:hypothetical protein
MKTALIGGLLVLTSAAFCSQVDRFCLADSCQSLEIEGGVVRFSDPSPPSRSLVIGTYVATAQRLVPATEAPIRQLVSARGWRLVVSAFLDHDEDEVRLRLRCFSPDGILRRTEDILSSLDEAKLGYLFGDSDEIFVVTSTEEHVYSARTEIWYLPALGDPRKVLSTESTIGRFSSGNDPGVTIERETYDGVHAETKGRVPEFWVWSRSTKALTLRPK